MGKNNIWISQAYYFEQVHPWIFIIRGGIAETQEAENLRKQKKKEKKEQEKKEKKEKKEKVKQEKKGIKEKMKQEEMKKTGNKKQDEKVEEALMMEEIDEEWTL